MHDDIFLKNKSSLPEIHVDLRVTTEFTECHVNKRAQMCL